MKTDSLPFWVLDILVAGTLLSRVPLPHLSAKAFKHSHRAVWAYPLIGAGLGAIAGTIGLGISGLGLPAAFAGGCVLAMLMLLTGAMHEDGLADTADGFWGAFDPKRRLEIMKDSHIGTYGVLALVVLTGFRWVAYTAIVPHGILPVIAVGSLSRAVMPCLMATMPHARTSGLSHSVGTPALPVVLAGLACALAVAALCVGHPAVIALVVALAVGGVMGTLARHKIGGQTGDILGATQQLCEVAALGTLLVLLA